MLTNCNHHNVTKRLKRRCDVLFGKGHTTKQPATAGPKGNQHATQLELFETTQKYPVKVSILYVVYQLPVGHGSCVVDNVHQTQ